MKNRLLRHRSSSLSLSLWIRSSEPPRSFSYSWNVFSSQGFSSSSHAIVPPSRMQDHDDNGWHPILPAEDPASRPWTTSSPRRPQSPPPHPKQQQQQRRRPRHGWGRLVATAVEDQTRTRLTTVAHQSPVRLIPLRSTKIQRESPLSAVAYVSNYGGGMLAGDVYDHDICVNPHARLGLLTQGHGRIYPPPSSASSHDPQQHQQQHVAQVNLTARVHAHSLLVMAPDPLTPYAQSCYRQVHRIVLHPTASLCAVDWIASGRTANGEHWQQDQLETSTQLSLVVEKDTPRPETDNNNDERRPSPAQEERPLLVDALTLQGPSHFNPHGLCQPWGGDDHWHCHAYVTLYLYGPLVQPVVHQCQTLATQLLSPYTRIRQYYHQQENENAPSRHFVSPITTTQYPVWMSVQHIDTSTHPPMPILHSNHHDGVTDSSSSSLVSVVRMVAQSNHDVYRVLQACLQPLSQPLPNHSTTTTTTTTPLFAWNFYQDRIHTASDAALTNTAALATPTTQPGGFNQPSVTPHPTATTTITPKPHTNTAAMTQNPSSHRHQDAPPMVAASSLSLSSSPSWALLLLADSCLPTGSFAHSSGLEAASQLGLLTSTTTTNPTTTTTTTNPRPNTPIQSFVNTTVHSVVQQCGPVVSQVHGLCTQALANTNNKNNKNQHDTQAANHSDPSITAADAVVQPLIRDILEWNERLHFALVSNGPACLASLDQGRSLLRVALQWVEHKHQGDESSALQHGATNLRRALLQALASSSSSPQQQPQHSSTSSSSAGGTLHWATVLGVTAAFLGLDRTQTGSLLGYCVARDVVSAAVRLNLVGPLASVTVLAQAHSVALEQAWTSIPPLLEEKKDEEDGTTSTLWTKPFLLASCAPVLDTIQPCHKELAVRLFRS